ncbi:MAG: ABC transporter permease [Deltaproteobacteria bacterium]|nr:ABC transporter permease [Deltaproteobacteria bacterium]
MQTARERLQRVLERPWIWSFLGALGAWGAAVAFMAGHGSGELASTTLSFAVFMVIIALGQMFVITTGPGNVDLSIPATIALTGAVAMKVMAEQDEMILLGLGAALLVGLAVGLFNYLLIWLLRIPPIIATMSSNFLVMSSAIAYGRGLRIKPPPLFSDFTTDKVMGIPVLAIVTALLTVVMGIVLRRTVFGRSVEAIGQNMRAAWLAGVQVGRTRLKVYLISATLAGLCGALLAGFSGGSSLDAGEAYLLASIAVVVIGGTSVAGGRGNIPGLWGAALFLYLLEAMLNTYGAGAGVRMIMTGLIIIAVITIAGGEETR